MKFVVVKLKLISNSNLLLMHFLINQKNKNRRSKMNPYTRLFQDDFANFMHDAKIL